LRERLWIVGHVLVFGFVSVVSRGVSVSALGAVARSFFFFSPCIFFSFYLAPSISSFFLAF
jgi:hypothetical protein